MDSILVYEVALDIAVFNDVFRMFSDSEKKAILPEYIALISEHIPLSPKYDTPFPEYIVPYITSEPEYIAPEPEYIAPEPTVPEIKKQRKLKVSIKNKDAIVCNVCDGQVEDVELHRRFHKYAGSICGNPIDDITFDRITVEPYQPRTKIDEMSQQKSGLGPDRLRGQISKRLYNR